MVKYSEGMRDNTNIEYVGYLNSIDRPKDQLQEYAEITIHKLHMNRSEVVISFQVSNPMLSYIFVVRSGQPRYQYFIHTNDTGSMMMVFHKPEIEGKIMVTVFDLNKDPAEWRKVTDNQYTTAEE